MQLVKSQFPLLVNTIEYLLSLIKTYVQHKDYKSISSHFLNLFSLLQKCRALPFRRQKRRTRDASPPRADPPAANPRPPHQQPRSCCDSPLRWKSLCSFCRAVRTPTAVNPYVHSAASRLGWKNPSRMKSSCVSESHPCVTAQQLLQAPGQTWDRPWRYRTAPARGGQGSRCLLWTSPMHSRVLARSYEQQAVEDLLFQSGFTCLLC